MITLHNLLIILLILSLFGAGGSWFNHAAWGYRPLGISGLAIFIIGIMLVLGKI